MRYKGFEFRVISLCREKPHENGKHKQIGVAEGDKRFVKHILLEFFFILKLSNVVNLGLYR